MIVALPGLFSYLFFYQILVTLTAVLKPLLPNFSGRAIVTLNFSFEILSQTQCLGRKI